jgi:hypothetical protein
MKNISPFAVLAAMPPKKYRFTSIRDADREITRLEGELAAKGTQAAPAVTASAMPSATAAPAVSGRQRFINSVIADAGAKQPSHPHLKGRERFTASVRVAGQPENSPAEEKPLPATLKGRERFNAAVAKDFQK